MDRGILSLEKLNLVNSEMQSLSSSMAKRTVVPLTDWMCSILPHQSSTKELLVRKALHKPYKLTEDQEKNILSFQILIFVSSVPSNRNSLRLHLLLPREVQVIVQNFPNSLLLLKE